MGASSGATPQAKRRDASLWSFNAAAVRRTFTGFEVRDLEEDVARLLGDLGREAAHHSRDGDGTRTVGDEELPSVEAPLLSVERRERLSRAARAGR